MNERAKRELLSANTPNNRVQLCAVNMQANVFRHLKKRRIKVFATVKLRLFFHICLFHHGSADFRCFFNAHSAAHLQ